MSFNTRVKEVLSESLLEGASDYSDVMDSLTALGKKVEEFSQMYPMDRGTHIHGAYKAEIDRIIGRLDKWIAAQNKFVQTKAGGVNPDTVGESRKRP